MRSKCRVHALLTACSTAAAIVIALATYRVGSAAPAGAPSAQPAESSCSVAPSAYAWPTSVTLGETLQVALIAAFECHREWLPTHLVLVLDGSSSTPRGSLFAMKRSAHAIVEGLALDAFPENRVGVVEFKSRASISCELTDDTSKIRACIDRVESSGGAAIDQGIERAMQVLRTGCGGGHATEFREIIIVFGDGFNIVGCDPVAAEAAWAKGQDVLVITVCLVPGCDTECFERTATSKHHLFDIVDADALTEQVHATMMETVEINPLSIDVSVGVAANMPYVPGSAAPPAIDPPLADGRLDWRMPLSGDAGAAIYFDVLPIEMGSHPVGVSATGTLRDSLERERRFDFTIPLVLVVPPPTPSPPLSTPSSTPTPTPTERPLFPRSIYLPLAQGR